MNRNHLDKNWGMVIKNISDEEDELPLEVEMPMQIRPNTHSANYGDREINASNVNIEIARSPYHSRSVSRASSKTEMYFNAKMQKTPREPQQVTPREVLPPQMTPKASNHSSPRAINIFPTDTNQTDQTDVTDIPTLGHHDSNVKFSNSFQYDHHPSQLKKIMTKTNKEWIEQQRPEILSLVKEELEHDDLTNMRERLRQMAKAFKEEERNRNKFSRAFRRLKLWWGSHRATRIISHLNPFVNSLQVIEKRFGSGVATYYDFFYSVIKMNFFVAVSSFLLLILPWLLRPLDNWPDVWKLDFLMGLFGVKSNIIGLTWFFFGGYEDRLVLFSTVIWPFAFVYVFVVILNFSICIVSICMSIGAKVTSVSHIDEKNTRYLEAVFNSYSFGVQSKEGVQDLQRYLATKLAEYRNADFAKEKSAAQKSPKELVFLVFKRAIGIAVSGFFLVGTPVAVYFIVQYYEIINSAFPFTTSVLSSTISLLFPIIISYMVHLEGYAERATTEWNIIIRTYVIKMSTTVALMVRVLFLDESDGKCRQTEAGLVFWQMIWIEFAVSIFKTLIFLPVRYNLMRCITKKKTDDDWESKRRGKVEFDVPENVIELLYRQSLIFVGMIMSPMIPIAGLFSNLVLYFCKYLIMRVTAKFPDNPYERGKSSPFNLNMLLLTFVFCLVPLGFFLFQASGSNCGPFRASALASQQMPIEAALTALSLAFTFYQDENAALNWENILFYAGHKITLGSLVVFFVIVSYFLLKYLNMFRMKYTAAELRANSERKEKSQILREYVQRTNLKY
ncbi:predicted protein [Naegleria gruberi]|uniref:Predicted protein n=1 Tax=Naegleria gruberi TaxID=5762 RepID=D2V4Y6_NAEGR|nr:uncharacterized protein NAEGRDRAFT_63951 [Naegleria gruberi]EFC48013.1 predicted protein [Naegleria gruberi]|eukprot:XP_002680757.1 predicted protein [Naegleria gruberi strain NEG-M]